MTPKVLFVLFRELGRIPDGGDHCNKRNISSFINIIGRESVDFFYFIDKDSWNEKIHSLFTLSSDYYYGITRERINNLYEIALEYDIVFLCSSLMGKVALELKSKGYKGKIISQFHNVESDYYRAVLPKVFPLKKLFLKCVRNNELMSLKYSDVRIALNNRDAQILNSMTENEIDCIIPITLEDRANSDCFDKSMISIPPLVMFLGSYFPPNEEGVMWFIENVLPYIHADFIVVGKGMKHMRNKIKESSRIQIFSDVPDMSEFLYRADFIVLPIFSGSGMKVKTCESLMYGKNIVGTNEAFEGYELDYDKVGHLCNTAQEFIDYFNEVVKHPVSRYNDYSRKVYLSGYSNEIADKVFETIID